MNPLRAKFNWKELPAGIVVGWDFFHYHTILDYLMFDLESGPEKAYVTQGGNSPTIQSRLEQRKRELEDSLAKVNAGLEVLKAEPQLGTALETLTKAIRA